MAKSKSATSIASKKATNVSKPAKMARSRPPASEMVLAAITQLNERKGSSLQAIKKYIAANYQVDLERDGHHIRNFLKLAVAKGQLTRPKGKGASGSFKLGGNVAAKPKNVKKPKAEKKASKPNIAQSPKPKKTASVKKTAPKKAVNPKAIKPAKAPMAKKPKVEPKTAKPAKSSAPKKATKNAPAKK